MTAFRLSMVLVCVAVGAAVAVGVAAKDEEYESKGPKETGSMAQFVLPEPPKDTTQGSGRDESKDPSKWIMNLVSTRLPPSKRYRRPTTVPPKALAQGATEAYDLDTLGLSVSPE